MIILITNEIVIETVVIDDDSDIDSNTSNSMCNDNKM